MAYELRQNEPGEIYHIYNRGQNKQDIFRDEQDKNVFINHMEKAYSHPKVSVKIHAFALMDNHIHIMLENINPDMPKFMLILKNTYTKYHNKKYGEDGSIWDRRYNSIPIKTQTYLINCLHYIHNNPADLPYVDDIARYRWSSLKNYLYKDTYPSFLTTNFFKLKLDKLHPDPENIMDLDLAYQYEKILEIKKVLSTEERYHGLKIINKNPNRIYIKCKVSEISLNQALIHQLKVINKINTQTIAIFLNLPNIRTVDNTVYLINKKLAANLSLHYPNK